MPTTKRMPSDSFDKEKETCQRSWQADSKLAATMRHRLVHQDQRIREDSPNILIFSAEHWSTFSLISALTPYTLYTC